MDTGAAAAVAACGGQGGEGGEGGGTGETRLTVAEAAAEELTAAGERIVPSCGRSYRSRQTPSCVCGP